MIDALAQFERQADYGWADGLDELPVGTLAWKVPSASSFADARVYRGRPSAADSDQRNVAICALLRRGLTIQQVADRLEAARSTIAQRIDRMRKANDPLFFGIDLRSRRNRAAPDLGYDQSLRRHKSRKGKAGPIVLTPSHPAIVEARPLFPHSVRAAGEVKRLLISGENSRKIGATIAKGPRRGWPIFTLTLPERTTCPSHCLAFRSCYGNRMHQALRIEPGAALEARLWRELTAKQADHPRGFLVRLHVLGDFYSEGYVGFWRRALAQFPALHVFGFTAWRPKGDVIGRALWSLTINNWERFTIRFSGMAGPDRASRLLEPGKPDPGAIACPQQTGGTECCATCALCFSPAFKRSIAFDPH